MTVPTNKESKENMRHSSSWPDRAVTVKVRVDPVSRAYTIIPTFSEDPILDVTSSKRDTNEPTQQNRQLEKLVLSKKKKIDLIDTRLSHVSENLQGSIRAINEKTSDSLVALRNDEADNEQKKLRGFVNFSTNDSSSSNGLDVEIKSSPDKLTTKTEIVSKDILDKIDSIDQKNRCRSGTQHLSLKSLGKNNSKSDSDSRKNNRLVRSIPNIKLPLEEFPKVTKQNKKRDCKDKIVVEGKIYSDPATPELKSVINGNDVDKASHFVVSTCNINSREAVKPPVIRIIDYDNVSSQLSTNWESKHACPKCKSDGFLELQVDPFRSSFEQPSLQKQQKSKKNCVETGTFPNRRFRSRSTTYDFRPDLGKSFGRRTKSFAGNIRDGADPNESPTGARPTIDHKKEITLRRHYYPEGGWGYVIVTCSALVHFLGIGLQLAAPGSWHISAERKFHHPALHSAGKAIKWENGKFTVDFNKENC